jgi:uncharacterized protein (TIGR02118 family)
MTGRFLARCETPAGLQAFDWHHRKVHLPLGHRLPGLRRYTVGRDVEAVHGGAPYYLVAKPGMGHHDEPRAAFALSEGRAVEPGQRFEAMVIWVRTYRAPVMNSQNTRKQFW